MSAELSLPAEPASVARARRFVRGAVQSLVIGTGVDTVVDTVVDDAELLVTELATNALLHARSAFTVEVSRDDGRLRICVVDGSPVAPRVRSHGADATTGRGLQLVQALSAAWGVQPLATGKTVWVELLTDGGRWLPDDDHECHEPVAADVDALLAAFDEEPDGPVARAG